MADTGGPTPGGPAILTSGFRGMVGMFDVGRLWVFAAYLGKSARFSSSDISSSGWTSLLVAPGATIIAGLVDGAGALEAGVTGLAPPAVMGPLEYVVVLPLNGLKSAPTGPDVDVAAAPLRFYTDRFELELCCH